MRLSLVATALLVGLSGPALSAELPAPGTEVEYRNPGTDNWMRSTVSECMPSTGRCQIDSWSDTLNAIAHRGYYDLHNLRAPGGASLAGGAGNPVPPSAPPHAAASDDIAAEAVEADDPAAFPDDAGAAAPQPVQAAGGGGVRNGRYECSYLGGTMVIGGGNIHIDGPTSYRGTDGGAGSMSIDGTKITFTSGPLAEFGGDVLPGNRIGLHTKGETFNNMTCALK